MKYIRLLSPYATWCYQLTETYKVLFNNTEKTLEEIIDLFKDLAVVKAYGVIRIEILEKTEEHKWINIFEIIDKR